jgi:hypothetical protein
LNKYGEGEGKMAVETKITFDRKKNTQIIDPGSPR